MIGLTRGILLRCFRPYHRCYRYFSSLPDDSDVIYGYSPTEEGSSTSAGRSLRFLQREYYYKLKTQNEIERRKREMDESESHNLPIALKYFFYDQGGGPTFLQEDPETSNIVYDEPTIDLQTQFFPFKPENIQKVQRNFRRNPPTDSGDLDYYEHDSDEPNVSGWEATLKRDEMYREASCQPEIPVTNVSCCGCGALLHCQDIKMPGFIPFELIKTVSHKNRNLCQRCYVIKRYNVSLKLNVSPDYYPSTISHIKDEKGALIVLITDLTDMPGSIWPNLMDIIGPNKRIILVGNKIDLLAFDETKDTYSIQRSLIENFKDKLALEGHTSVNLVDKILISARTGYNVEALISKIFYQMNKIQDDPELVGNYKGHVFLLGTTNVGKSSVFNIFLDSDMCKISAREMVEKASVSPVPGTTLSLLKFPVRRPDPYRTDAQVSKLTKEAKVYSKTEVEANQKLRERHKKVLDQEAFRTYGHDKHYSQSIFELKSDTQFRVPKKLNPKSQDFAYGRWCYDTPGSVSTDQLLDILTQKELNLVLSRNLINPRCFLLRNLHTILIGGIGRFDVIESPMNSRHPLRITLFCSDRLPINILETKDVSKFVQKYPEDLLVPSQNRSSPLPELDFKDFYIKHGRIGESVADIVLSSIGWISVAPKHMQHFKVRAWTPEGRGIALRTPSYFPNAFDYKGKRIAGTPAYQPYSNLN